MHFGDTIFIFLLALVVFGPKKLPEIGRQIGKLMVEFRRASNDFKLQIEEELRASEQAERQKAITKAAEAAAVETPAGAVTETAKQAEPSIMPPSEGASVSHETPRYENYNNEPLSPPATPAITATESAADPAAAEPLAADSVAEAVQQAAEIPPAPVSPNEERYYPNGSLPRNGSSSAAETAVSDEQEPIHHA